MLTLNVRLILTDHSPLPVPERPCEGVSWSVGFDAFFVGLSTLVDEEALAAVMYKCSSWKEKIWCWHLIGWEEKTLLGEKVLSTCSSYCVCTNAQFIWIWSSCACAWVKRIERVPNACAHEWEHPICIQKDVQYKQYAVRKGVLMGASKRNCSISNTWKRS